MKDTQNALKWIVYLLQEKNIPFQISWWFAARIYGSDRPLYDIDIEIPDRFFDILLPDIKEYLIYGPQRYIDENYDLLLMTLKYTWQEIDISWSDTDKFFNATAQERESCNTNIADAVEKEIDWLLIPLIPLQNLIAYKQKIRRPEDLVDIKNILKSTS